MTNTDGQKAAEFKQYAVWVDGNVLDFLNSYLVDDHLDFGAMLDIRQGYIEGYEKRGWLALPASKSKNGGIVSFYGKPMEDLSESAQELALWARRIGALDNRHLPGPESRATAVELAAAGFLWFEPETDTYHCTEKFWLWADTVAANGRTWQMTPESELKVLLAQWRNLKSTLQPTLELLNDLENKIKSRVTDLGEPVRISGASATIRNGYTRETWDGKALNGYAAAHPEILQFRSETAVKPAVVLKMEKE